MLTQRINGPGSGDSRYPGEDRPLRVVGMPHPVDRQQRLLNHILNQGLVTDFFAHQRPDGRNHRFQ
nr:MAG TPA_asm: hypothetical protein [Caudoviricetes sp.]